MKFLIKDGARRDNYSIIYRENEYSFDIQPSRADGFTSILINFLHLEIEEDGRVLYPWGLCPLIIYAGTKEMPTDYTYRSLFASLPEKPISGVSLRLTEINEWPVHVNKSAGWVCLGNPQTSNRTLIEFAPECVASLNAESELVAIWLHPEVVGTPPANVRSAFSSGGE